MRVLVLGGTAWLGGRLATVAVSGGHEVVCVARGRSGEVPPGAVLLAADRDRPGALAAVTRTGRWDVVLDVSRQPGQVRRAVTALAGCSDRFVLVSSTNVYAEHAEPGQDETAPTLPPLEGEVMASMATYGEAKVACENAVLDGFGPGRSLIARVGLIGGPGDVFDRTGYWPLRFARPSTADAAVLVPDAPNLPTQVIDVRDLSSWLVESGTAGISGVVNATGPTVTLREHLDVARDVAGHAGPLLPAPARWLKDRGVQPWMGERSLPLWLDDPDWWGFNAWDSSQARYLGLRTRPLADTLRDTLKWEIKRKASGPRRAGLTDDDERALVTELRASLAP